jgi:hypothetical protein
MKIGNIIAAALVILTPFLSTQFLLKTLLNTDLSHFRLAQGDEITYWQEINTFKAAGFHGGYFSMEELVAKLNYFHFGIHGPVFAVIMGSLARIFGWAQTSGPWFNMAFLSIALLVFLLLTKPGLKSKLFLILAFLSVSAILFYIPSSMQESLIQALTIILAGVLIRLSRQKDNPAIVPILGLLTALVLSLLRVTWVLVFFPLIYLIRPKRNLKWLILSVAIAAILSLLLVLIFSAWTSPYPYLFLYQLTHVEPFTVRRFLHFFVDHFIANCKDYVSLSSSMNSAEIVQRYTTLFVTAALGYFVYKKKYQFIVPLFILVSEILATFAFNTVGTLGDLRILAPYLIISLLFLVVNLQSREVSAALILSLVFNLALLPIFILNYQNVFVGTHFPKEAEGQQATSAAMATLTYQPGKDPWCNSILTDVNATPFLLSIQGGMGVNTIVFQDYLTPPIHSHYLYIDPERLPGLGLVSKVEVLAVEGNETLYAQTNDGCFPKP